MAIAKKPIVSAPDAVDRKAAVFIAASSTPADPQGEDSSSPVMVRMTSEMKARIDIQAKRRGISRAAFIKWAVSEMLENSEALPVFRGDPIAILPQPVDKAMKIQPRTPTVTPEHGKSQFGTEIG